MNLSAILAQTNPQTFFLPQQASNLAGDVDWAWNIILWTTTVFFFIVVGSMTFFVFKYRRKARNEITSTITHNTPLEIIWTAVPLLIVIMFFFVGFKGFINYDTPASNSRIVEAEAHKWKFTFTYPNGSTSDELYVELGKAVRINMHSTDVLHALYIPVFRTQRNFVPYRQTYIWFVPTDLSPVPNAAHNDPGGWPIFCTQYCGEGHSEMVSHVHVLKEDDYNKVMLELANPFRMTDDIGIATINGVSTKGHKIYRPYADLGKKLYEQIGCNACHTVNGKSVNAPTWLGLWKRPHTFSATVPEFATLGPDDSDDKWVRYITDSVTRPAREVVSPFSAMPVNFEGTLSGSEFNNEKLRAIIEYMKSIGTKPADYKPAADPKNPADAKYFDAEHPLLFDKDHNPVHPESLQGIEARKALEGGGASAPASAPAAP